MEMIVPQLPRMVTAIFLSMLAGVCPAVRLGAFQPPAAPGACHFGVQWLATLECGSLLPLWIGGQLAAPSRLTKALTIPTAASRLDKSGGKPPHSKRADVPAGMLPAGPVPQHPGAWVLPNGRLITPAGKRITLGNFPLGLVETPDGRYLIVVNNGAGRQSLQVVETATGAVIQTEPVHTVFNGVAVSPDGRRVYAAGGGANAVLVYAFAQGRLAPEAPISLAGYPTGLALAPDGKTLCITCNLARHVAVLDTSTRALLGVIPTGLLPFGIALTPDGRKAYVTNWAGGSVSVLDTRERRLLKTIPVGGLPCAVVVAPDGRRVYVANANTDTVSVYDTASDTCLTNISQAPYPHALYGSVPNGMALSPDG